MESFIKFGPSVLAVEITHTDTPTDRRTDRRTDTQSPSVRLQHIQQNLTEYKKACMWPTTFKKNMKMATKRKSKSGM